jgi:hypothetical protein
MTRLLPLAALFALFALAAALAAPAPLRVKASPAVAPCVAAAARAYERTAGTRVALETGALDSPASAGGADVVVGADAELHHILESFTSHPDLDVDVARIPWVLTGAPGTATPDVRSLDRSAVRVLGGTAGREAWRSLSRQGLAPGRAERFTEAPAPLRLRPGEAAIVPLSLAGPGPVTSLPVPPIVARALGVRASTRPDAARAFLGFLAEGAGNEAFRACGRSEAP